MIKDVMLKIKILTFIRFSLFLLMFIVLFLGCDAREKIYLDYNEVILNSYYQIKSNEINFFYLYNKKDTIYLDEVETETREMNYLNKINITPTGVAVTKLSKNTFENTTPKMNVDLPEIFIVKKDSLKKKLKIIEVKQLIIISRDNFEI